MNARQALYHCVKSSACYTAFLYNVLKPPAMSGDRVKKKDGTRTIQKDDLDMEFSDMNIKRIFMCIFK
jgi:hypothetical protein